MRWVHDFQNRMTTAAVWAAAFLALFAALTASPRPAAAQGQLDVKTLLGNAVSDGFEQFTDVKDAITKFKYRSVDLKSVRGHLEVAKKKFPKLPPAEVMLANMFFSAQNLAGGRAALEEAVQKSPDDPEAYVMFGELALRESQFTDSELLFTRGLSLADKFTENPKRKQNLQVRSRNGLAAVSDARKNWKDAERQLRAIIEIDPDNAAAFNRLGRVLFFQGKSDAKAYDAAYKAFQTAAVKEKDNDKDSKPIAPEVLMGALYDKQDDSDSKVKAEQFMVLAAEKNPKDLNTLMAVARWAMFDNKLPLAEKYSEMAVKLDKESLPAKLLRGSVARLTGDLKTAELQFAAVHLQSPSSFEAANNLALVLIEEKEETKRQRALEFAGMNFQRFPINSNSPYRFEAAITASWVSFELGRVNEANQLLAAVMQAGVQLSPDADYYRARMLELNSRSEDAIPILKNIITSEAPFVHRKDAQTLLDQLEKRGRGSSGTDKGKGKDKDKDK